MATAHQPEPEKAEPTSPEPPSAPAPVPSRDHRLASALATDGATAARIIPAVLRWGGHLSDAAAYDVALSVARECRQRNLRPELVAALIKVESTYRVDAVSPTNDHGLMQLHGDRVYQIDRNIALGCLELATWRDTYDCGEREMLAHYNGGCNPPRVSWGYADRVLALAEEVH
jgi:soluble lytic murein transglycosylase-like protein